MPRRGSSRKKTPPARKKRARINTTPKVNYFNRNTGDGQFLRDAREYAQHLSQGEYPYLNTQGRSDREDKAWGTAQQFGWNKDKMNAHAETVFDNTRRRRQKKVENDKRWCNKKNTEKEREECELRATVVGVGAGGAYGCSIGAGPGCLLGSMAGGIAAATASSSGSPYVYPDKKYGEPPATMTMERGGRRKKKTRRARRKLKRKTIKRRRRKRKTNKKR